MVNTVKDGWRCLFLDCDEAARVRVTVVYSSLHEGRSKQRRVLRLCMVHAELLRSIIDIQILGAGLDAAGSDDGT